MAKRQVFFSFEYMKDNWRASQVRNMGKVSNDSTFSDNDWEEVKYKTDENIKRWINDQLEMRSCVVVLIGETTANRKWINYEIEQAYKKNKGLVGIYIHNLKDKNSNQSNKGKNPFDYVYDYKGNKLSDHVKTFDSSYITSNLVYNDINNNIENLIEDAIKNGGLY